MGCPAVVAEVLARGDRGEGEELVDPVRLVIEILVGRHPRARKLRQEALESSNPLHLFR